MSAAHGEQVRIVEEHVEEGRSMHWWGMIFFIASEALIFANLIAAFLYLEIRGGQTGTPWLLPNGEHLDFWYPLVNTVILVASSFTLFPVKRNIRRGNWQGVAVWIGISIFLGAAFLGGQVYEYLNLILNDKFSLATGAFGSGFFTLTGFHGLHVTIGIIFLLIVLIRALRGHFSEKKHFAIEAAEMYWHFVDIVWIFVFSTVYLLPQLLVAPK
ncbi:MAG: heme-copper oxidase subunit III [Ktedonobacteraceae bacterium]|nr:heme-copper oxidase subunit III [Ktedonobacteraceae bacterium]